MIAEATIIKMNEETKKKKLTPSEKVQVVYYLVVVGIFLCAIFSCNFALKMMFVF